MTGCRVDNINDKKDVNTYRDRLNHFKLRAECPIDVLKLRELIGNNCHKMVLELGTFPDTLVDLYTTMNLDEVRMEIRGIEDGHVMLQTLAIEKDYTGERDYEIV